MPLFGPPNVDKLKSTRDVQGLIKALEYEKSSLVRSAAARALGDIGDPSAVAPLTAAAQKASGEVREAAVAAIFQIGARAFEPHEAARVALKDPDENVRETAALTLGKIGHTRAVEPLVTVLKSGGSLQKRSAAEALGKIGDVRAVKPLAVALKDDSTTNVRAAAAEALGKIGDVRAIEALVAALEDEAREQDRKGWDEARIIGSIWPVRRAAIRALGKISDARVVEPLIAALKNSDPDVCVTAAGALGDIRDGRATEPLIVALRNDRSVVRVAAARALGMIRDARAIKQLEAVQKEKPHDKDLHRATARALSRIRNAEAEERPSQP